MTNANHDYDYDYETRNQILQQLHQMLKNNAGIRIIDQASVGPNEWLVLQDQERPEHRWIGLASFNTWNHPRDIHILTEHQQLNSLDCPERILAQSTQPPSVWKEHALLDQQNKAIIADTITPGDAFQIKNTRYVIQRELDQDHWSVSAEGLEHRLAVSKSSAANAIQEQMLEHAKRLYQQSCHQNKDTNARRPENTQWLNQDGDLLEADELSWALIAFLINLLLSDRGANVWKSCRCLGSVDIQEAIHQEMVCDAYGGDQNKPRMHA